MAVLALALVLDWFIGDPDFVWRRIPHPVAGFGRLIEWFDKNRSIAESHPLFTGTSDQRLRRWGAVMLVGLLVLCISIWWILSLVGSFVGPLSFVIEVVVVGVMIAQKSLRDHVEAVETALHKGDVEHGREAVSLIVGRDVSQLEKSGVVKAAIESLAENFSDGVVAPALWYIIGGLPGILFYKAVNTADSMVGHRNKRYEHFGNLPARLDDAMNWPAARLSALLVVFVTLVSEGSNAASEVWSKTRRDAPSHRSPNAGWPEAAFAASLGLSLGGPRRYGMELVDAPMLNPEGLDEARTGHIEKGLALFRGACFSLLGFTGLAWLLI